MLLQRKKVCGQLSVREETNLKLILLTAFLVIFLISPLKGEEIKKPHGDCLLCHKEKDSKELKFSINELCLKCHPLSTQRDHPVNLKATVRPDRLPLDTEGKITCITCHEPHGKTKEVKLLRMQFNILCQECHKMY